MRLRAPNLKRQTMQEQVEEGAGFDAARYMGTWFEIATSVTAFELFCSDVRAEYSPLSEGRFKVRNLCKIPVFGEAEVLGVATPTPDPTFFHVVFPGKGAGGYRILLWDEDYGYALVGDGERRHFWVLSRSTSLSEGILLELLDYARSRGYPTHTVRRTHHGEAG